MINYFIKKYILNKYFLLFFFFSFFLFFNFLLFLFKFFFSLILFFLFFYYFKLTNFAKKIIFFFNESKLEISKVYWPSIKEAMKTTFVVFIFSFIFSLIVWFFDNFILYMISVIIGLRL